MRRLFVPTADELDDKTQYVVDATAVLVMGFPYATILRQTHNYRYERPSRGHTRRVNGMDFRPDRRQRGTAVTRTG